jgi:hypothetical protein
MAQYQVQIPDNLKPTIEEYINNSYKGLYWNNEEKEFLLTVYYRYVQQLGNYKSVDEKVRRKKGCSGCVGVMRKYFVEAIEDWHEEQNPDEWQ